MRRFLPALFLAAFVATLVLPQTSEAGPARVRALAGGDERLLPYDDGNMFRFPNRINEHQRIAIHNISPNGTSSSSFEAFQNGNSWLEASWEMGNGTAAVNVNRPTMTSYLQLTSYERLQGLTPTPSQLVSPAQSMIDIGYANDSFGWVGSFGFESQQDLTSNFYIDAAFGKEIRDGMELALNGAFSKVLDENNINIGLDARGDRGDGFLNHWTGTAFVNIGDVGMNGAANDSAEVPTDGVTVFGLDATAFHYAEGQYASGLTTLVGIGGSFLTTSGDAGMSSALGTPRKASALAIPNITAGAEYAVVSWLDIMGSISRDFVFTFGDGVTSSSGAGSLSTTMGAAAHWGRFRLEAELINSLFENGPDFIGGNGNGVAAFVSGSYGLN